VSSTRQSQVTACGEGDGGGVRESADMGGHCIGGLLAHGLAG